MKKAFLNVMSPITWIAKMLSVLVGIFFLVLYLLTNPLPNNPKPQTNTSDLSKEEFLEQLTPYAQEVSKSHGIRPSLLVAQAALESNWGQSQLAQESNNFFGIKSASGKEYPTKEFRQDEWTEIDAAFKEYDSIYASVLDYADLLKKGTSWNANLYEEVINAPTYQEAAHALNEAGYATDPNYAEKIIQLIEANKLDRLDHFK